MSNFYHDFRHVDLNEGTHVYRIAFPAITSQIVGPINFSIVEPEKYIDCEIVIIGESRTLSHIDFHLYSEKSQSQVLFDLGFWY